MDDIKCFKKYMNKYNTKYAVLMQIWIILDNLNFTCKFIAIRKIARKLKFTVKLEDKVELESKLDMIQIQP